VITVAVAVPVSISIPPPFIAPSLVAIPIMSCIGVVFAIVGLEIALFISAAPGMPVVIPIPVTVRESERGISKRDAEIDGRARWGRRHNRDSQQCERNQCPLDSLPHFVSPASFEVSTPLQDEGSAHNLSEAMKTS
jgi:hypothetical protein